MLLWFEGKIIADKRVLLDKLWQVLLQQLKKWLAVDILLHFVGGELPQHFLQRDGALAPYEVNTFLNHCSQSFQSRLSPAAMTVFSWDLIQSKFPFL